MRFVLIGIALGLILKTIITKIVMAIYKAIMRSRKNKEKAIMDATYDKVLGKIKEASTDGEVTYFSVDDIWNIKEELKYK